jgi:serine/threonine-protein kinase 24/25/MST4
MTAQDLLKHKFIKSAKKTESLKELVDRKKSWDKVNGKQSLSNSDEDDKDDGGRKIFLISSCSLTKISLLIS